MKAHRKGGIPKSSKNQSQTAIARPAEEASASHPVTTAGFFAIFASALVAGWLAFLPSLSGPFIFDDFGLPFADPRAASMPPSFWIGGVRRMLMASYWLNFALWDQNPLSYHVVNLCLHALATVFVCLCALSLLKAAGIAESRQRILAIFVSGIFLLHPLQTESVDYIAGRSEVLTGVFYFAAFAVFLQALRSEIGFGRVLAILALFGAATLSKEHAVTLPVLLAFTGIYWNESGRQHIRRGARLYAVLAAGAVVAAAVTFRLLATAASAGFGMKNVRWYQYFLTQCRVVPNYLRLFIVPAGQNADWGLPFDHGLFDHGDVYYLLAICIAIGLAIRYRRRAPLLCYGFLVFLLLLAPTSTVVPIKDAMAERRMYLPIFGLAIAAAGLLASLKLTGRNLTLLVVVVLTLAGALSYRRSEVWTSEVVLWRDVVSKSPANVRAYRALGAALVKANECGEAIRAYQTAVILFRTQPGDEFDMRLPLASAYLCSQERAAARAVLHDLSSPEAAKMYDDLGILSAKDGDLQQALRDFNDAIRIDPNNSDAYAHRGLSELAKGDAQAAEGDCRHSLSLNPGNGGAQECLRQMHQ